MIKLNIKKMKNENKFYFHDYIFKNEKLKDYKYLKNIHQDYLDQKKYIVKYSGKDISTSIHYFENGVLHNPNGPAIISENLMFAYYKKGKLHNEKGAALFYPEILIIKFFNNDKEITEENILLLKTIMTQEKGAYIV